MDTYRIVLVDGDDKQVGDVLTIPIDPSSIVVVMPQPGDVFTLPMSDRIKAKFEGADIRVIVLPAFATFARLERIEP